MYVYQRNCLCEHYPLNKPRVLNFFICFFLITGFADTTYLIGIALFVDIWILKIAVYRITEFLVSQNHHPPSGALDPLLNRKLHEKLLSTYCIKTCKQGVQNCSVFSRVCFLRFWCIKIKETLTCTRMRSISYHVKAVIPLIMKNDQFWPLKIWSQRKHWNCTISIAELYKWNFICCVKW